MGDITNAQNPGREIIESLDQEFARLHLRSRRIIESTSTRILYAGIDNHAEPVGGSARSVGESVLRAAATVEQTFGGITSNLWDDPFEWTLPEYLSTPAKILEHLEEVEATRQRAFSSFADDSCLQRLVSTPSQETKLLLELLCETLKRAISLQHQAAVTLKNFSGNGHPGFII